MLCSYDNKNVFKLGFNTGVATGQPNGSLGRVWEIFQKYWFFGPIFDKNCGKTPRISENQWISIQDWAAKIFFWAACGPRARLATPVLIHAIPLIASTSFPMNATNLFDFKAFLFSKNIETFWHGFVCFGI